MNDKDKAIHGIFWSGTEKIIQQILKFLFYVLLARLLEPSSFGLIGMLTIFLAVSQALIDSGLGNALIQKKDRDEKDSSTVFSFNFFMSIILYFILFFLSPIIASFYHRQLLINVFRILSFVLVINSFFLMQVIKLRIELDFKTQTQINLISTFVAGIISVFLAYYGFGVWALVYYQLLQSLIKAVLYNMKELPIFGFYMKSFKKLFGYGSKLLAASLINNIFYNIYNVVIGKTFNATELGYYERAKKLQNMITDNVNSGIQIVSFPFMSKFQDNQTKLEFGYRKIFSLLAFLNFPLMFFLILSAKPLIIFLLSEKWSASIPFLQLLAIVGLLYPIHSLNMNILEVKGRTDILLKIEIVKKIIVIIIIIFSIKYGIKGLIIGQIIASLISFVINSEFSGKLINIGVGSQIIILLPYFLLSIVSYIITFFITKFVLLPNILLIFLQFTIFFTFYIVSVKILKMDMFYEVKENIIRLRKFIKGEK